MYVENSKNNTGYHHNSGTVSDIFELSNLSNETGRLNTISSHIIPVIVMYV